MSDQPRTTPPDRLTNQPVKALSIWWLIQEAREHLWEIQTEGGVSDEQSIADRSLVEAQVELIGDAKSIELWNERRGF